MTVYCKAILYWHGEELECLRSLFVFETLWFCIHLRGHILDTQRANLVLCVNLPHTVFLWTWGTFWLWLIIMHNSLAKCFLHLWFPCMKSIHLLPDVPRRKNRMENYCKNSLWIKRPDQFSNAVSWDGIFFYSDSWITRKKNQNAIKA